MPERDRRRFNPDHGRCNQVPVVEGTTHDEDRVFVALQFDLAGHPVIADQYPALIQGVAGAVSPDDAITGRLRRSFPMFVWCPGRESNPRPSD